MKCGKTLICDDCGKEYACDGINRKVDYAGEHMVVCPKCGEYWEEFFGFQGEIVSAVRETALGEKVTK